MGSTASKHRVMIVETASTPLSPMLEMLVPSFFRSPSARVTARPRQRNEPHGYQRPLDDPSLAILRGNDQILSLGAPRADGTDEPSLRRKLILESARDLGSTASDDDRVEGSFLGPASRTASRAEVDVPVPEPLEPLASGLGEGRHDLDREDLACEGREDGRLVSA